MPDSVGRQVAERDQIIPLSAIEHLNFEFRPIDSPLAGHLEQAQRPDQRSVSSRLPQVLSLAPHAKSLCISFNSLDRRTRLADWTVVRCTRLSTIELRNLEISEASLLGLLIPSAKSLSQIILDGIFLCNGTWATLYRELSSFLCITDITGVRGRRYVDDRCLYSQADAASYCIVVFLRVLNHGERWCLLLISGKWNQ